MTQGELEKITIPFERQMSFLEMRIMSDIVRAIRINGFSTATADNQIQRLMHLGRSETDIRNYVTEALKATEDDLYRIFSDEIHEFYYGYARAYDLFGLAQVPFDDNMELRELLESVREQTTNTFRNITGSMGFAIKNPVTGKINYSPLMDFYQDTLDSSVMEIASGTISYNKALVRAVNTMTNSGLRWIDYNSGHHARINVAARNAIMTGFRQVQGKINEQVARDLDTDSYEVSFHVGARATHQVWQGRVHTYEQLRSICGLGTVTGIHGANCYHDYIVFIPGVSVRTYTDEQLEQMAGAENTPKQFDGKEYTTYESLQEQRKQETEMRKTRADIKLLKEGEADKDAITIKQARYQVQMQQYKYFSKKMGLPEQLDRVYLDGLGRAGRPKSTLKNANGDIIIKVDKASLKGIPGLITQTTNRKGGINRNYYGKDGKQKKQITNNNHGTPKSHPWGTNGEHAHDYVYDSGGKLISRIGRDLMDDERKENMDIL